MYEIDQELIENFIFTERVLPDFISEKAASKSQQDEEPDKFDMCLAEQMKNSDTLLVKYCKFYMAMQANLILKETRLIDICKVLECKRGDVQNI